MTDFSYFHVKINKRLALQVPPLVEHGRHEARYVCKVASDLILHAWAVSFEIRLGNSRMQISFLKTLGKLSYLWSVVISFYFHSSVSTPQTSRGHCDIMHRFFCTILLLALAFNSLCISAQMLLGSVTLNSSVGSPASKFRHNMTTATPVASRPQSCGPCVVGGPNVDVYYWPQPSVNTSCLSIIGPTPSPPLAGATTSNGVTYWGSTETDPPYSYLMTMILTAVNGITFKMPLQDPWPFATTGTGPVNYTLQEPIGKRAHATRNPFFLEPRAPFNESRGTPLSNDPLPEGNRTLAESTVVYNGHAMWNFPQKHIPYM